MEQLNPTLWRTCRVLAGQTRLRLLGHIFKNPDQNVSRLAVCVKIGEPDASQELRRLQSRGLLRRQCKGASVFYRPIPDPQVSSASSLLKALKNSCGTSSGKDKEMIRIAKALAHEKRILIAQTLMQGPQDMKMLLASTSFHPSSLHRHLQPLIKSGFIHWEGRMLIFNPPKHPLAQALSKLLRKRSVKI